MPNKSNIKKFQGIALGAIVVTLDVNIVARGYPYGP